MKKQIIQLTTEQLQSLIEKCVIEASGDLYETKLVARTSQKQCDMQEQKTKDYVGKTFKFFAEDRTGFIVHLLFTFEKVTKLDINKTILTGDIVFRDKQICGDRITIDFAKKRVQYRDRETRYSCNLEIDNRMASVWNKQQEQLQTTLPCS